MSQTHPSLEIDRLTVTVGGKEILHEISLTLNAGEIVAVMGPNGSGKSTLSNAIMGRDGYKVESGSIAFDGREISELSTYERAVMGLSLISQYPGEVPGVDVYDLLEASLISDGSSRNQVRERITQVALRVGLATDLLERWLNVDLSGGEKKRLETVLLSLNPGKYAILDEIDSGLDIDALRDVAREIQRVVSEKSLGILAITHYSRLLKELVPGRVLVLVEGEIVAEGGPELAQSLEATGYGEFLPEHVTKDQEKSIFSL